MIILMITAPAIVIDDRILNETSGYTAPAIIVMGRVVYYRAVPEPPVVGPSPS